MCDPLCAKKYFLHELKKTTSIITTIIPTRIGSKMNLTKSAVLMDKSKIYTGAPYREWLD